MSCRTVVMSIISPKLFFGALFLLDSNGMDYYIEIKNDNSLKFVSSKRDSSVQIIHVYSLSDVIEIKKEDFDFESLIFRLNFKLKTKKTLNELRNECLPCKLTLLIEDGQIIANDIQVTDYKESLKFELGSSINNVNFIRQLQKRFETLPDIEEVALVEFKLEKYILYKNLKNPQNDLFLNFHNMELGFTFSFGDDRHKLQVLTEFKSQNKEFLAIINSNYLEYLESENYDVKIFKKYVLFQSTIKDSKFYIKIKEMIYE